MHHGTVLGRQTHSSLAFTRGGDRGCQRAFSFTCHLYPLLPPIQHSSEKPLLCASVCVPADVDFDARFSSNRQFFSRNLRMSRIVLRGNAPSGAQRNHNDDRNEKISERKTLNVQRNFWRVSLPSLHDSSCQSRLKWHCDRRFTI